MHFSNIPATVCRGTFQNGWILYQNAGRIATAGVYPFFTYGAFAAQSFWVASSTIPQPFAKGFERRRPKAPPHEASANTPYPFAQGFAPPPHCRRGLCDVSVSLLLRHRGLTLLTHGGYASTTRCRLYKTLSDFIPTLPLQPFAAEVESKRIIPSTYPSSPSNFEIGIIASKYPSALAIGARCPS